MKLNEKWFFYALGAGAASLPESSQAAVIYSNPEPDPTATNGSIFFDLQSPATGSAGFADADFRLFGTAKSKAYANAYGTSSGQIASQVRPGQFGNTSYAIQLSAGETIGSTRTFASNTTLNNHYGGGSFPPGLGNGDWEAGESGFLGLSIVISGTTHYGWASITLNSLGASTTLTLHDYAYEDAAGAPIGAGVPEPSSVALLIAGAAGIAALRRRAA